MPWIQHPVRLSGRLVQLEPLSEAHFDELISCGAEPSVWTHLPFDGSNAERLRRELGNAVSNRIAGSQYPFTIVRQQDNRVIGATRLFDIFEEHKKLEIGWTWLCPEAWGKGYNTECKLLLLTYIFETLGANRVQLKTRNANVRSKAAIEKIGGIYEGTLRADRIMSDGSVKDTVVYSIIKDEWAEVKGRLESLVDSWQLAVGVHTTSR